MSSLYCRLTDYWLKGLIPADQVKCDKESWECLDCYNYLGPGSLEENLASEFEDDWSGQVFSP